MTTPSNSEYREIDLGKGRVAIIDAKNFERINKHKWYAWWNKNVQGFYAVRHEPRPGGGQRTVYMHRTVLGLKYGDPRKADHIDRTLTLKNTIDNLRKANSSESQMNRGGWKGGTQSGVKNITTYQSLNRGTRYTVTVTKTKSQERLTATFGSMDEAIVFRDSALKHLHGEFACFG